MGACAGRLGSNHRFGSERKMRLPSSGFRIQSRYTIAAYGSCSIDMT